MVLGDTSVTLKQNFVSTAYVTDLKGSGPLHWNLEVGMINELHGI